MEIIAGLTMGTAFFLLWWFLFSPGAKNLVENYWKEQPKKVEQQPVTASVSSPPRLVEDYEQLQNATDWRIMKYYAYGTFVDGEVIHEQDRPKFSVPVRVVRTAHELKYRLEKSCTWLSHEGKVQKGHSTDNKDAILIQNIKTGVELYIGWHDGRTVVGSKLHEHTARPLRTTLISDSI